MASTEFQLTRYTCCSERIQDYLSTDYVKFLRCVEFSSARRKKCITDKFFPIREFLKNSRVDMYAYDWMIINRLLPDSLLSVLISGMRSLEMGGILALDSCIIDRLVFTHGLFPIPQAG